MAWMKARIAQEEVSVPPSNRAPPKKFSSFGVNCSFSCWSRTSSRKDRRLTPFNRRWTTCDTIRPYNLSAASPTLRQRVIQLLKKRWGIHLKIGNISTGGAAPASMALNHSSVNSWSSTKCRVLVVFVRMPNTADWSSCQRIQLLFFTTIYSGGAYPSSW